LVGYHRAAEMILTGRRFSARQAQAMGLINSVFADDQFQNGLVSLSEELLGKSGAVLRLTVKAMRDLSLRDFDQALRYTEEIYCSQLLKTADVAEGVAAFLEKRSPSWRHS